MKRNVLSGLGIAALFAFSGPAAAPAASQSFYFTSNRLPPANGMYALPVQGRIVYANGAVISNLTHRAFTQSAAPPAAGSSTTHSFSSVMEFDLSVNKGPFTHVSAPASVTLNIQATGTTGGQQNYTMALLSLMLSGGSLPSGVQAPIERLCGVDGSNHDRAE